MFPDEALASRGTFERYCDGRVEATARVLGEYVVYLDTKDRSVIPHLVREGYWEAWTSVTIARHIEKGMWCVDAGANLGYFSLLMAGRGAEKVLAVEPCPSTAALLKRTIETNDLGKIIRVEEAAISDQVGRADLLRFGDLHGSDSLLESRGYEITERMQGVRTIPLDLLVGTWKHVDFVKIDVEGFEERAWHGMQFVRKWHQDLVVCMEIMLRPDWDARAFLERLADEKKLGLIEEDGSITPTTPSGFLEHPMTIKHDFGMVWLS